MKSIKFFSTSIVSLLIFFFYYAIIIYKDNGCMGPSTSEIISTVIYAVAFLSFVVFFILGWVVKDKPSAPKNDLPKKGSDTQDAE